VRFSITLSLLALSTLASVPQAHAQSLEEVRTLVRHGEYEQALELLEIPSSVRVGSQERILRAQILYDLGRYREASDLIEPLLDLRPPGLDALIEHARLLSMRDRLSRAVSVLSDVLDRDPGYLRARLLRALYHEDMGQAERARGDFEAIAEALRAGRLTNSADLAWAGVAVHHLGSYEEANAAFDRAVELDPESIEPRLYWADLLLEKHRPDQALELCQEVLNINPRHPEALVCQARAGLQIDLSSDEATALVRTALDVNPRLPEALELLAEIAIDDERYQDAIDTLDSLLLRNPARLHAQSLAAAAYFLLDERRPYRHIRSEVFERNPSYADFYVTIADYNAQLLRNDAALELYRRALRIDDQNWRAQLGMGIGLSRNGDDERGLAHLQRALELDPFNVRAFNFVQLYEEALSAYEFVETDMFRYRFHRDESAVLSAYIPEVMESAYAYYRDIYGIDLELPISVEVFAEPETFAVRSVGLPHIGPHGVCFGRLITSRSPNDASFNWGEVLSHELSHAFALEMSDARVPRWLSEGIADFDTTSIRPEWRREDEMILLARLQSNTLPSITDLDRAFLHIESSEDANAAYAQSIMVVRFLVSGWGREAPASILRLLGEHRRLPDVIEQLTGLDMEAFDEAFVAFLRDQLEPLLSSFEPNLSHARDEAALEAAVLAHPDDADALAELAVAHLQGRRIDECESSFNAALAIDPDNALATYVSGSLALRERRFEDAEAAFDQLVQNGHDGYTLRIEMAYLARRQGRSTDALEHYRRAQAIYPFDTEPYREMADIYLRAGQQDEAIALLQQLVLIDQNSYDDVQRLLHLLLANERFAETWDACVQANHINPFDAERHHLCGRVAIELGDIEAAQRELTVELELGAAEPDETRRLLESIAPVEETPPPTEPLGAEL